MTRTIGMVILMAVITYAIRFIPITVFQRQIRSRFIKSFLYYVPYAVLAALTFPGIFYATKSLTASVAGTLVAVLLAFLEQSLVVVALGAILGVVLCSVLL